jgi:DNA-binding transcriptional LysR family regulator
MLPKTKELQHLVLLAEERHFAKAAQRAFLSQSAFSRSISALEDELGLKLFDRGSRHVHITADGERILQLARRLLASASDLTREAALLRGGEVGDIAIGSGPYTSVLFTVPVITTARQRFRNVRFRLEVDHTAALLAKLEAEEIQLFLSDVKEIPGHGPWTVEPLGSYSSTVIGRAAHPHARRRQLQLSQLAELELATVHIPGPIRRGLAAALGYAHAELLPVAFECESVSALREFVLRSDAVVLAPAELFRRELDAGLMTQWQVSQWSDPRDNPVRVDLGLVRLSGRTPTSAMRMLVDLMRVEARQRLEQHTANKRVSEHVRKSTRKRIVSRNG